MHHIDGLLNKPLNPKQISNEDNAYNICSAHTGTARGGVYFQYSLRNTAPDCYSVYDELIHKSVNLDAPISQTPTLINPSYLGYYSDTEILFTVRDPVTGDSPQGKLAVEQNGDLYWHDLVAASSASILVATNVTSIRELMASNDGKYLNVDGGLYYYEAGPIP